MTTSDPLLPSSGEPADTTVAAEPGVGAAQPQLPEAHDIVFEEESGESLEDALAEQRPVFRTPEPGAGLSPKELAAESD